MNKEKLQDLLTIIDSENSVEWDSFEFEGNKYYFKEIHIDGVTDHDWQGGGKYQTKYQIFQVVRYDNDEEYDLYISQLGSRTGSYYSDYYYEFERKIVNKVVTHIPEKTIVIPAHDEIQFVEDK